MTPGARLQAAIELFDLAMAGSTPADRVAADYFRNRRYAGGQDRRAIQETVYGLLRHYARLDWILDRLHVAHPTGRPLMLAYLAMIRNWSADQIAGSFDGGEHRPAILNREERGLLQSLVAGPASDEVPGWVAAETPSWLYDRLRKNFGDQTDAVLQSLNQPAETDLRVNLLQTTREAAIASLAEAGIVAQPTIWSPWGLRLDGRPNLAALPIFKEGGIEVQDEGSQLIALLTDARPGHRVADFCAGAGGKTLALAAAMNNKGHIIATDVLPGRIERSAVRLKRAGVHNVERRALKDEADPWVKRHARSFDRVLIDAPCLGIGTWRRNPDAKWKIAPDDVERLTALQQSILQSASRLVKPGGRLIYATCSLLPEENSAQIDQFIATHPDFTILPYETVWQNLATGPAPCVGPFLTLTPLAHGTDGFFCAVLERAKPAKTEAAA